MPLSFHLLPCFSVRLLAFRLLPSRLYIFRLPTPRLLRTRTSPSLAQIMSEHYPCLLLLNLFQSVRIPLFFPLQPLRNLSSPNAAGGSPNSRLSSATAASDPSASIASVAPGSHRQSSLGHSNFLLRHRCLALRVRPGNQKLSPTSVIRMNSRIARAAPLVRELFDHAPVPLATLGLFFHQGPLCHIAFFFAADATLSNA